MKKLHRSADKMVSGVLGGVGEYLEVDPNLVRLLYLIFLLCTGIFPGVFIYIIAAYMLPQATAEKPAQAPTDDAAEV